MLRCIAASVATLAVLSCNSATTMSDVGAKTCPIHGDRLLQDSIPWVCSGGPAPVIPPGEGAPGLEYEWQAEQRDFPFACTSEMSGCLWYDGMKDMRTQVLFCPSCRSAKAQWERAHPDPEYLEPKPEIETQRGAATENGNDASSDRKAAGGRDA